MADQELESMTVKLKGDATSYQKMLTDSSKKISEFGKTANAAWAITEKSFIQAIRSVDAMMSRTVASITNGIEGIVRISVAVGEKIIAAWSGVLDKVTGGISTTVGKWIGSLGGAVGNVASFVDKYLAGIPSAIGTTLFGVSQVVGTVLAGAFGVAGAAVLTFGREITQVFHQTLTLTKEARHLGVTVLDLRAGMLRFGVSAQTLGNALTTTQTKLVQFGQGSRSVREEVENLSRLSGSDVYDIASGWEGVFNAIASIQDPAKRAAQAFRFMGSSAKEFLNELDRGGVGDAKGMAKRLGLDLSAQDQENLRQISQFTRDVEALKTGLANQTMLGLAPIAAELSQMFSLTKIDITFIKDMVTDVGIEIAKWGAILGTALTDSAAFGQLLSILTEGLISAANFFWDIMESRAKQFISNNAYWLNPGYQFRGGEEMTNELVRGSRTDAFMRTFRDSPLIKGFNELARGVEDRRRNPITGVEPGKSTPSFMIEKLTQSFDSMVQSLKQPIDLWRQSLNDLKQYASKGLFSVSSNSAALMAAQAFKQLRESTGMAGNPMFAGAASFQSTEAYSAIAQFEALRDRGDIQQQMKDAIMQGNRQRDLLISNGQAVIKALQALGQIVDDQEEADL